MWQAIFPKPPAQLYLRHSSQSETQLSNTAGQVDKPEVDKFAEARTVSASNSCSRCTQTQSMENTASFDSKGHDTTETSARSHSKEVRKLRNYHFSGLLQIHFTSGLSRPWAPGPNLGPWPTFVGPFRFKIYTLNLGLWALSQLMTTIGHKKFESVQLYRDSVLMYSM